MRSSLEILIRIRCIQVFVILGNSIRSLRIHIGLHFLTLRSITSEKKYPKPWDQVSVTNKDMQVIEDNFDFDDDDDEGNDDDDVDKSNGILLCW